MLAFHLLMYLPHREDLSTSTSTFTVKTPVDLLVGRIRELERALATLQATYHTTPHPLLRKELREIANQPERSRPPPPADGSDGTDQLDQLSENLGTLSMTGYGRSRFFGPTGSAWVSSVLNMFFVLMPFLGS